MDINDIDREIGKINLPQRPGKRLVDITVKHARIKIILLRLIAVLFIFAIAIFGLYSIINAKNSNIDPKIATAAAIIYIILAGLVSLKLWNIDYIGWLVLFCISLASIILPVFSAFNHGIMIGTLPIIIAAIATILVLIWTKDLYGIKKMGDFFNPR